MSYRFAGKVVLITGGGSGIGRVTASAFAREGAMVVVSGQTTDTLVATVKEIEAAGGAADHVVADVTDADQVRSLVETVVTRHGGLNAAVNNAGTFGQPGSIADLDRSDLDAVMTVNVAGTWLCMKYEIAHMRANGGGVIVNVASNIGAHGRRPNLATYAASKAAVSVLTRNAALDHIADGIRINAVSPGATDTRMSLRPGETDADRAARLATAVPLGRVGTREEVASAILWLASDDAAFAVGHDLVLDGGATA